MGEERGRLKGLLLRWTNLFYIPLDTLTFEYNSFRLMSLEFPSLVRSQNTIPAPLFSPRVDFKKPL